MKILLVSGPHVSLKQPYAGGTEAFIVGLANRLVEQGHEVDVIARESEERDKYQLIEFSESSLSMKDNIHAESKGQEFYRTLQFGLFDTTEYDVIHYNVFTPSMYAIGTLHNTPSLVTLHIPPNEKHNVMYSLFAQQTNAMYVAVSERLQEAWQPILNTQITCVHNGIDLDLWSINPERNPRYLLWNGRINPDKNPVDAIHVANELNIPLRIVGKITDQAYFNNEVSPLLSDTVTYEGHVTQPQLAVLLSGAYAVLATATWNEPFGLTLVEALASGVPIVGFQTAIPEMLRLDNISVAVKSQNWKDLLPHVTHAMTIDPQTCRSFAQQFNLTAMAEEYSEIYRELSA